MTLSAAASTHVPLNDWLSWTFAILLLIATCYAAGRLHQWFRQGLERDHAFQTGYDKATKSLFSLATRVARPHSGTSSVARRGLPPEDTGSFEAARVPVDPARPTGPRHRASDKRKLTTAKTQKMHIGDLRRSV